MIFILSLLWELLIGVVFISSNNEMLVAMSEFLISDMKFLSEVACGNPLKLA